MPGDDASDQDTPLFLVVTICVTEYRFPLEEWHNLMLAVLATVLLWVVNKVVP